MSGRVRVAALVGNLLREEGGAQQLLYDVFSSLPDEFQSTVYYMFGEATFREDFEDAGVRVRALRASSKYDIGSFRRLVGCLRSDTPHVLQTNSTVSGPWGRVAARIARVPAVVSVEHTVHDGLRPYARLVNGATLPLADQVVGVSDAVVDSFPLWERLLLQLGTEIRTIYNGVDVEHFAPGEAPAPRPPVMPTVGAVGRLIPAKGYRDLLRGWPRVVRQIPDARLRIVGDGPMREPLEGLAEELSIAGSTTFVGYVPDPRTEFRRFDVAAFPSLREGLSLTAAQAMASGVPLVTSNLPSFRTLVGETGVTVPQGDPTALAEALVELLTDPERRSELATAGRKRIEERFSIDRVVKEYAALYRRCAGT